MKKLTLLLCSLFTFASFANECGSLNLEQEKDKLQALTHLQDEFKEEILSMKRKVKQAQVFGCVDRLLAGEELALTEEERDFATYYLNILKDAEKDPQVKSDLSHALEVISGS